MRTIEPEELRQILDLHRKWLARKPDGKWADLSEVDLREADLSGSYLKYARLRCSNLTGADLRGSDLAGSVLIEADLNGSNLTGAFLNRANLAGADLSYSKLKYAKLIEANLTDAVLTGADLSWVILNGAKSAEADLTGSNLRIHSTERYTAYINPKTTQIGCKNYSNDQWRAFTDDEINEMATGALDWWNNNKAIVFSLMDELKTELLK